MRAIAPSGTRPNESATSTGAISAVPSSPAVGTMNAVAGAASTVKAAVANTVKTPIVRRPMERSCGRGPYRRPGRPC